VNTVGGFDMKDVIFSVDLFSSGNAGNAIGELSGKFQAGGASGNWLVRVNDGTQCSSTWTGTKAQSPAGRRRARDRGRKRGR
jgi:hypothetical protein